MWVLDYQDKSETFSVINTEASGSRGHQTALSTSWQYRGALRTSIWCVVTTDGPDRWAFITFVCSSAHQFGPVETCISCASQELCYVCMQRAQRNKVPLYQSDETRRVEREQERVLMLREHQKDLQYFQKEEVPELTHSFTKQLISIRIALNYYKTVLHLTEDTVRHRCSDQVRFHHWQTDKLKKREDSQRVAAFNLGVAEAQRRMKAQTSSQSHVSLNRPFGPSPGSVCVSLFFWSCDTWAFRARTSLRVDPVLRTACRSRDATCRSWCRKLPDADRRRRRRSWNNRDWTNCVCCSFLKSERVRFLCVLIAALCDLRWCDCMCLFCDVCLRVANKRSQLLHEKQEMAKNYRKALEAQVSDFSLFPVECRWDFFFRDQNQLGLFISWVKQHCLFSTRFFTFMS